MKLTKTWLTLTTLALAPVIHGCPLLEQLNEVGLGELAPEVEAGDPELRHGPTLDKLAAYYCPLVIGDPLTRIGCAVALGPSPPKSSLAFEFGIGLTAHNPNDIPIPALDVLLALTLFEGQDAEGLGAICVAMCGEDDPECDGTPPPDGCESDQDEIRTMDDFVSRIPGLIEDLATGEAQDELRKSVILAGGDIQLDLSFVMGIDQALSVFEKTALGYVEDYLAGRSASLTVPVSAEGSFFFDLPSLGRLGVAYGPMSTVWDIPTEL